MKNIKQYGIIIAMLIGFYMIPIAMITASCNGLEPQEPPTLRTFPVIVEGHTIFIVGDAGCHIMSECSHSDCKKMTENLLKDR